MLGLVLFGCSGWYYKEWENLFYPEDELDVWKQKLKQPPVVDYWAYFNNTRLGHAPWNALSFIKVMNGC